MDKTEKIKEWVKKQKKEELARNSIGVITGHTFFVSANELLSFLDTLSEEPCKSLEEAAEEHSKRVSDGHNYRDLTCGFIAGAEWQKQKMFKDCVIVECSVRVYPTLDDKPRPWVALYKNGIESNSLRDIPELENIGFKDDDTAIVIIKRKEDGQ